MKAFHSLTSVAAVLDRPDVDTDQIIPKQFLKRIERTGYGEFLFFDWRQDPDFELNRPGYDGARILLTGPNFGCGSSREHAPESLKQWGIKAIVGGSFAEIFFGNCTMLGIPCMSVDNEDVLWLQRAIGRDPRQPVTVDVEKQEVRVGDRVIKGRIPDGARNQLVSGAWNATGVLLEAGDAIEATAKRLPYVSGF